MKALSLERCLVILLSMMVKACVCTAGVLQFQSKHGYQQARWKVSGETAEIGLGGEDDDGVMERGGEDHAAQHVDHTDEVYIKCSF